MSLKLRILSNTLKRTFSILDHRDRRILGIVSIIQVFLGLLDLIGVALIGVLGALSINGIQSKTSGSRVMQVLELLNISNLAFQLQAAYIGILAVVLLVARTLISVYFIRRTYFYLSVKSSRITGQTISKLLERDLIGLRKYSTYQILYSLTTGVNSITIGIIGTTVSALADVSILTIILAGLFVADTSMGISVLCLFSVTGITIYFIQQRKAKTLGEEFALLNIKSEEKIVEAVSSFREIKVHNSQQSYANRIEAFRLLLSNVQANLNFMPQVSKYVIESTLLLGTLMIAGVQFYLKDATHAIGSLAIFLAAASRVAPAVLRLQQGMILVRTSVGNATPTLDLIEDLSRETSRLKVRELPDFTYKGFRGDVLLSEVNFGYDGGKEFCLNNVNLEIQAGSHVAIVGASGSGKTTLVDIILGLITPQAGHVKISGKSPDQAIESWPGAISYVPQEIKIFNATLAENVALGYEFAEIDPSRLLKAIESAGLHDLLAELPNGIATFIGENGNSLSGGQRQRIGIARALYTNPRLMVLDEATSSLDGQTEQSITEKLQELGTETTLITIAHRLSTVRKADLVIYMETGRIIATGTFQEVREKVPNFDLQANLMGLIREAKVDE